MISKDTALTTHSNSVSDGIWGMMEAKLGPFGLILLGLIEESVSLKYSLKILSLVHACP